MAHSPSRQGRGGNYRPAPDYAWGRGHPEVFTRASCTDAILKPVIRKMLPVDRRGGLRAMGGMMGGSFGGLD